jgi:hypothetical protein
MLSKRNFTWTGLGFCYLVAILTAMQVGLAADQLKENATYIIAVLLLRYVSGFIAFSTSLIRRTYTNAEERKKMHESGGRIC